MRKPRSILVLLLLLAFGVSLAVPPDDMPETTYDESETLPYEGTPQFSMVALQAPARMGRTEPRCGSNWLTEPRNRRLESNARSHWIPDSLTVLNHSFLC